MVSEGKRVIEGNRFEPLTAWTCTRNINSINALSGVAYGTRSLVSPPLVVLSLSVAQL